EQRRHREERVVGEGRALRERAVALPLGYHLAQERERRPQGHEVPPTAPRVTCTAGSSPAGSAAGALHATRPGSMPWRSRSRLATRSRRALASARSSAAGGGGRSASQRASAAASSGSSVPGWSWARPPSAAA